jgi:hypothetical protein
VEAAAGKAAAKIGTQFCMQGRSVSRGGADAWRRAISSVMACQGSVVFVPLWSMAAGEFATAGVPLPSSGLWYLSPGQCTCKVAVVARTSVGVQPQL